MQSKVTNSPIIAGLNLKYRFLFVICLHFLNSTRSPTTHLSRITDEKELNPNTGGVSGRRSPRGKLYLNYRRVRVSCSSTAYLSRFTDERDLILTQMGLGVL